MKLLIAVLALAATPPGFEMWTGGQLKSLEQQLAAKAAGKSALQQMANYGNHSLMMVHRQADGEAEVHTTQVDVFIVQSGAGTLVMGGTVVGGKTTAPNEIRGASIQGGDKRPLAPGDIVHIPAKLPHQVLVEAGKRITYSIVKVDSK